jgi:hypothetical protein
MNYIYMFMNYIYMFMNYIYMFMHAMWFPPLGFMCLRDLGVSSLHW